MHVSRLKTLGKSRSGLYKWQFEYFGRKYLDFKLCLFFDKQSPLLVHYINKKGLANFTTVSIGFSLFMTLQYLFIKPYPLFTLNHLTVPVTLDATTIQFNVRLLYRATNKLSK